MDDGSKDQKSPRREEMKVERTLVGMVDSYDEGHYSCGTMDEILLHPGKRASGRQSHT